MRGSGLLRWLGVAASGGVVVGGASYMAASDEARNLPASLFRFARAAFTVSHHNHIV